MIFLLNEKASQRLKKDSPSQAQSSNTTLRSLLLSLLKNQSQVLIETPFTQYTGVILSVRADYIVLTESDESLVLIRLAKVITVTEI